MAIVHITHICSYILTSLVAKVKVKKLSKTLIIIHFFPFSDMKLSPQTNKTLSKHHRFHAVFFFLADFVVDK